MNAPVFDARLVRDHVEMIHRRADGIDGELVVAVFGEDPKRINPTTGKPGVNVHRQVARFRPGEVEQMFDYVMRWSGVTHANVYMPLHVIRRGLPINARGKKEDIVAVLGLVADLDSDTGKTGELPIEPAFVIETSPGNRQPVILFERPISPAEAEPLAKAMQRLTGGDFGTGDIAHVWRVPGTANWPNAAKLERGRSPEPVPVCLEKAWTGTLISVEVARAALAKAEPAQVAGRGHWR